MWLGKEASSSFGMVRGLDGELPWWVRIVSTWDYVLGDYRTGWFAQVSDFSAGWGDTLSFGITRGIRWFYYANEAVDFDSWAYFIGQGAGIVHGLLMLGPNIYCNVRAQWHATGSFWKGLGKYFYDPRSWHNIRKEWTQWWGRSRIRGPDLHHAIFPQRWKWVPEGLRNAGFNYTPTTPRVNRVLFNKRPWTEWVFRGIYITQFNPVVNLFNPAVNPYLGHYVGWWPSPEPIPVPIHPVAVVE